MFAGKGELFRCLVGFFLSLVVSAVLRNFDEGSFFMVNGLVSSRKYFNISGYTILVFGIAGKNRASAFVRKLDARPLDATLGHDWPVTPPLCSYFRTRARLQRRERHGGQRARRAQPSNR